MKVLLHTLAFDNPSKPQRRFKQLCPLSAIHGSVWDLETRSVQFPAISTNQLQHFATTCLWRISTELELYTYLSSIVCSIYVVEKWPQIWVFLWYIWAKQILKSHQLIQCINLQCHDFNIETWHVLFWPKQKRSANMHGFKSRPKLLLQMPMTKCSTLMTHLPCFVFSSLPLLLSWLLLGSQICRAIL